MALDKKDLGLRYKDIIVISNHADTILSKIKTTIDTNNLIHYSHITENNIKEILELKHSGKIVSIIDDSMLVDQLELGVFNDRLYGGLDTALLSEEVKLASTATANQMKDHSNHYDRKKGREWKRKQYKNVTYI